MFKSNAVNSLLAIPITHGTSHQRLIIINQIRPYVYGILPLFAVTISSVPSISVPSGGERVSTKVSISDAAIDLGWI